MPRFLKIIIICTLFSITAVPVFSELYQYRDENGIMRLTDNKYSVPVDNRSKLEQFSEFEGVSDELVILPIQKKSLSPTQNQSASQIKTEKVILPRISKEIPVKDRAQEDITRPEAGGETVSASNQTTPPPFTPLSPKKIIQEPDPGSSVSIPHKSKKITIDRTGKKTTAQKTTPAASEKNIQKRTEPIAEPENALKSGIVSKDQTQKIIPEKPVPLPENKIVIKKEKPVKDSADAKQTALVPKTDQAIPEKEIQKSSLPDIKQPAISKKSTAKSQAIVARLPEKTDEITAVKKTDSKAVSKNAIKTKNTISDKKTADSQEIKSSLSEKMAKKATEPEKKTASATKIKPETKPEAKPKTKPKTRMADKIPAKKPAINPPSEPEKETQPENLTVEPQTVIVAKTPKTTSSKNIEKVIQTETKTSERPEIGKVDKKPASDAKKVKKEVRIPEKTTEIKSAKKTGIATDVKKEAKVKNITADKKSVSAPKAQTELLKKSVKKETQTNIEKKDSPEIKPEPAPETNPKIVKKDPANNTDIHKYAIKSGSKTKKKIPAASITKKETSAPEKTAETKSDKKTNISGPSKKEKKPESIVTYTKTGDSQKVNTELSKKLTKKATQPNIKTKAVPEIEKDDTDRPSDAPLAKKDSDSVMMTAQTDSNKPAETKKIKPATHLVPSKEQRLNQDTEQTGQTEEKVTQSPGVEADNNKTNQRDESIILAKLESTRRILANKKKALNEKFSNLMKEKQEIENSVDEDDEKSVLTYNESVKKLNIKIKQYKIEKKALQAAIEKYNKSIKQSTLN